jgi:mannose-6-phosphate isomerase
MIHAEDWTTALHDWHSNHALPLWSTAGIDAATGTAWEALDHHGTPLPGLNRRQRVQFRQANAFARSTDARTQTLGWHLFSHTMTHGFDPNTGLFAAWVSPNLQLLDQTHDLYDLAFGVLAAASLGQAGYDVAPAIVRLERALDLLRAPAGWHETAARRQPRRQNPHMHLFEAATALYALTRAPAHRAIADQCLGVITTHALRPDGTLLEFFDPDWTPLSGEDQAVEPGHMAEWIYLAEEYTRVTGDATGLPLLRIWDRVLDYRLPSGFLPDSAGQTRRRLWPQTELLKAATVMQRKGMALTPDTRPEHIARRLWGEYMNTPVQGGWYDCFEDTTGALVSEQMPASTFYHIDLAVGACAQLSA